MMLTAMVALAVVVVVAMGVGVKAELSGQQSSHKTVFAKVP